MYQILYVVLGRILVPRIPAYASRNFGYMPHNSGYEPLRRGYEARNSGNASRNSGYMPHNSGYEPLRRGYEARNSGYMPHNSGYASLRRGYEAGRVGSAKTPRARLCPVGKTNGTFSAAQILAHDEKRAEYCKAVKTLIDGYHKRFIFVQNKTDTK